MLPQGRLFGLLEVCTQTEGFTAELLWIFLKSVSESLFGRRGKGKKKRFHVQRLPSLLPNLSVITSEIPPRINKRKQPASWRKPFHLAHPS